MLPVGQSARHKQCRAIVVVVFQLARHRPRPLTIVGTARIGPGITCDRVSYSTEQTFGGGDTIEINATLSSMSMAQEVDEKSSK